MRIYSNILEFSRNKYIRKSSTLLKKFFTLEEILDYESDESLERIVQRNFGCPIPGSVKAILDGVLGNMTVLIKK